MRMGEKTFIKKLSFGESAEKNKQKINKAIHFIKKYTEETGDENIAINMQMESSRQRILFKTMYKEIFRNSNATTTFYINNVMTITEKKDVEKILKLYHQPSLGGHIGKDKMIAIIAKFYTWNEMKKDMWNENTLSKSVNGSTIEYIKNGKIEKINKELVKRSVAKHTREPPETVPIIHLDESDLFNFIIDSRTKTI